MPPAPTVPTVDDLVLSPSFTSIGVTLPGAYPPATLHEALTYRETGSTTWRSGVATRNGTHALPLWSIGDALEGCVLDCTPATEYEVRVTLDGTAHRGIVRTRADGTDAPHNAAAVPTHHVSTAGNDAADGRTPATAWRTLEHAVRTAPPGAVVQLAPGRHAGTRSVRRTPLALVAEYPAVRWNHTTGTLEETNRGRWSIVVPSTTTGARSEVPANTGAWVAETRGQNGVTGRVWRLAAGSPVASPEQVVYSAAGIDREAHPTRLAHWAKHTTWTPTVDAWAAKLYGPDDWIGAYHYGFWSDNASPSSLYVRLPRDADPNQYGWTITADGASRGGHGLTLDGGTAGLSGCLVAGIVFRCLRNALRVNGPVHGLTVRQCLFEDGKTGVYFVSQTPARRPVIQDCLFRHTALSSETPESDPAVIPWRFVKQAFGTSVGKASESYGIYAALPPVEAVVRRCVFDGAFDGIAWDGATTLAGRDAGRGWDVTGNLFRLLCDDPLDVDNVAVGLRVWRNTIDRCFTALSVVDVVCGPVYFADNRVHEVGMYHMRKDGQGRKSPGGDGYVFKIQGDDLPAGCPPALVCVVGCDVLSTYYDPAFPADGIHGAGLSNGSTSAQAQVFLVRGTRLRVTGYVWDARPSLERCLIEDGNDLSTSATATNLAGLRTEWGLFPDLDRTALPRTGGKTYRGYGKGRTSNVRGGRTVRFTDPLPLDAFVGGVP